MFGLGPMELGLILLLVLVVFGAGKLPKVMGQLGSGLSSFRRGVTYDPRRDDDLEEDKGV